MPITAKTKLKYYERLLGITREIASTHDLSELLKKIVNIAVDLSDSEAASILLYDDANRQLYFQCASNFEEPLMRGITVPLENSIAGWSVLNRKPIVVQDVREDPRHYDKIETITHLSTRNIVVVPLISTDRVLGVLEVLNKREGEFSKEDLEWLTILGAQTATAIETIQLFQQSDYMAEMVHDIRTPLAAIRTASYVLQKTNLTDSQRTELARTIYRETERLNDLASSFLDLSRLESGRYSLDYATFNIQLLIDESTKLVQPQASNKGIEITTDIVAPPPIVNADRTKIKQVLLNLLTNAIKYNHTQGKIHVKAWTDDANVLVSIADTGYGISSKDLPHLFEKFYRVPDLETIAAGTGLGLFICKRIIDYHRGRINVDSVPGKSTTFTIYLPLEPAELRPPS